jgi:hypothetical protein
MNTLLTMDDVYLLIGHAEYMRRVEGKTELPAALDELAGRLARIVGDDELADEMIARYNP